MRKCLIALIALLPAALLAQTVWTWVDENGRRHYSDTEVAGATQVEVGGAQTFSGSALTLGRPTASSTPTPQATGGPEPLPYTSLAIVSPRPEETLRNIEGNLVLSLSTAPALSANHRIDVVVDGTRRNLNTRSLTITVPEVYRGEHQVQVVIVDSAGSVIQQSAPVRFFVQQTSTITSPAMQGRGAPPASGNGAAGSQ